MDFEGNSAEATGQGSNPIPPAEEEPIEMPEKATTGKRKPTTVSKASLPKKACPPKGSSNVGGFTVSESDDDVLNESDSFRSLV